MSSSSRRVAFVTGGTGFIGSHLVDRLLADGWDEIRCLFRSAPKWLEGLPVRLVPGTLDDLAESDDTEGDSASTDVADRDARASEIDRALSDATHIFHFAALTRSPSAEAFTRANVEAPLGLIHHAERACERLERILIASSLAVVGTGSAGVADERSPLEPVSAYGRSKYAMEQRIADYLVERATGGVPITVIRPPAVYGPRERDIYTYFQAADRGICAYPADRRRLLSLAHVDDVVEGAIVAAEHPDAAGRTYFVGAPETVGWRSFVDELRSALGRRALALPVPTPLFRVAGRLMESACAAVGVYPPFHREKAREMLDACAACSVQRAAEELEYRPKVGLSEGLRDTLEWYRRNRWL